MRQRSSEELLDRIRTTRLSDGAKGAIWERIESAIEPGTDDSTTLAMNSPRSATAPDARRRRLFAELAVGAAGVAVVVGGGLYVWQHGQGTNHSFGGSPVNGTSNQAANAAGNAVGNGVGNAARSGNVTNTTGPASGQVQLPVLQSFSNATNWRQPNTSPYAPGVINITRTPSAPKAFEEALRPQQGIAELLVSPTQGSINADQDANPNPFGPRWTQTVRFTSGSLSINGQTYTVPAAYSKQKLLVLPIDSGIVWSPVANEPTSLRDVPKSLHGGTPIYYTPYLSRGGSLITGAVRIAAVPHRWMGIDGPTIASAWTGWLPSSAVTMPKVQSDTVMHETFKQSGVTEIPTGAAPVQGAIPGWSTVFMRDLTKPAYYKSPHYAAFVRSLTRTNGGFVLSLNFLDATMSGRNAGLSGANYYWSEKTRKWTPIDQTFTVQTLAAWTDIGSDGVYEMQPLGVGNGSGNELDVAEMHFDPSTLTMSSVWLGDWMYGPSFVDGNSWVAVLSRDMPTTSGAKPQRWTVYTP